MDQWLRYYYLVSFDCFPLFLHFLTPLIKLIWLEFLHRQEVGWRHGGVGERGKPQDPAPFFCSLTGVGERHRGAHLGLRKDASETEWKITGSSRGGRHARSLNQRQHSDTGEETWRKFFLGFSLSLLRGYLKSTTLLVSLYTFTQ